MNIIFLDVDGVLNSHEYMKEKYEVLKRALKRHEMFDPICMNNLKQIVDKTKAEIVITSSWKIGGMEFLTDIFGQYDIRILDRTKNYGDRRGKEIREWLSEHDNIFNYIIIDDDYFKDYPGLDEHIVRTSFYTGRGLNEEHVNKAVKLLGEAK